MSQKNIKLSLLPSLIMTIVMMIEHNIGLRCFFAFHWSKNFGIHLLPSNIRPLILFSFFRVISRANVYSTIH